jgi:hypothetical protein
VFSTDEEGDETYAVLCSRSVLMTGTVLAQDKAAPSTQDVTPVSTVKPLMVSGRVSKDGRTLWTDIDSECTVNNSDILKGLEGRLVKAKCYVDTKKNQIQILSVKKEVSEANYAATHTDSAFRR